MSSFNYYTNLIIMLKRLFGDLFVVVKELFQSVEDLVHAERTKSEGENKRHAYL
jgi:hypothetical protein